MPRPLPPLLLVLLLVGLPVARAQTVSILPLGDSITAGADFSTGWTGGYRDPLYQDLVAAGVTPQFVGVSNSNPTALLTSTGNTYHDGFGGYHIRDIAANLNGVADPVGGGDSNLGGYWFTGGHGTGRGAITPDLILLGVGTNDFLQFDDIAHINDRITSLVEEIHSLSPNSKILIGGAIPVNNNPGFNAEILAYDEFIADTLVPSHSYTSYVNLYAAFTNPDGSTISSYYGADNIHPNDNGYPVLAGVWANSVEDTLSVPEPSTYGLLLVGGLGLLIWQRRFKLRS